MRESTAIQGELRALVVAVSAEGRKLVRDALECEPHLECKVAECEDVGCAKDQLASRSFDLIVIDGCSVGEVASMVADAGEAAVVFLAREPSAPSLREVMSAGATDYFSKAECLHEPSALWLALRQCLRYHEAVRERSHLANVLRDRDAQVASLSQRLWRNAPHDFRTGWYSHRQIIDRLHEEIQRAGRYKMPLSVILGDMQGVAELERTLGDGFVDHVLAQLSKRARYVARQTDLVGHYGNDSFLIILTNTDIDGAVRFCGRMNDSFSEPVTVGETQAQARFAFGVVTYVLDGGQTLSDILREVEGRLETARDSGEDGAVVSN